LPIGKETTKNEKIKHKTHSNHYRKELNGIVEFFATILLSHKKHSHYTVEPSADDGRIRMLYSVD
jgi:hypothetical protein